MSKSAIIFNGIHFYLPVAERAFSRATQSNGSVVALFLKAKHEATEGYGFPSDLDDAENLSSNEDADADDNKIIASNIRLLEHQAVQEKVHLDTRLLEDPSAEEFERELTGCEIIFAESDRDKDEHIPIAGINIKKLFSNITIPVETVR